METNTASTVTATITSTPTHEWLVDLAEPAAAREFDVVFADWLKENSEDTSIIDHYETALLMFGAGYLARRNDELTKEKDLK